MVIVMSMLRMVGLMMTGIAHHARHRSPSVRKKQITRTNASARKTTLRIVV